jgi:hypothetical protein
MANGKDHGAVRDVAAVVLDAQGVLTVNGER